MGPLGAVIVAADRAFHVVACRFRQNQGMLGTVQVKHGVTGLVFLHKSTALRRLQVLFPTIGQFHGQIHHGSKRSGIVPGRSRQAFDCYVLILHVHTLDRSYECLVKQAKRHAGNDKRQQQSKYVCTDFDSRWYQRKDALAPKIQSCTQYEQQKHARQGLFDHRPAHVTLKVTWQAESLLGHKN